MKLKVLILTVLAFVALVLFGDRISGVLARRQKVQTEMNLLREKLGLADLPVACERHGWTCPASVTVSNQVFTVKAKSGDSTYDIWRSVEFQDGNGMIVANGTLGITPSFEHALSSICHTMIESHTVLGQWSIDDLVHFCRVEWDATGNVIIGYHFKTEQSGRIFDHSCFWGAYGNLCFKVDIKRGERTVFDAKTFAMPFVLGGVRELTEKQRKGLRKWKELCRWETPENDWRRWWFGCGACFVVLAGLAVFLFRKSRKGERT